ncbi:MAG: hypothetical protein QOI73_871 [Solirubrobacteraceae bacterium]|nr:hypothetical protein [Solirubrobacteraceae bacterium]
MNPRWTSRCIGCEREDVEVESRYDHGARVLCDRCAASPPPTRAATALDVQAPARNGTSAAAPLRFLTVAELRALTPREPTWIWNGYLAAGSLSLLAGKPKAGKSTLAFALSTASSSGATSFLGRDVLPGAVVYVSEEGSGTLLHKLPEDGAGLHLLTRDEAWPKPEWPMLVGAAVDHARKVGARLLVIDTAAYWAALPAEREKDAGAVQGVMFPLVRATREGLAVLLVHHARKAGGEDGDAVRGSGAWAGSVDTILELERPAETAPPTQRLLLGLGRYPQTPACALIDHDPSTGSWALTGHAEDRRGARSATMRSAVLAALADGEERTRPELEEATGTTWRELLDAVNALVTAKLIDRGGEGRKGSPYIYRKAVADPPPQKATAPTASGSDSVVCHVVTPQNRTLDDSVQPTASATPTAAAAPIATDDEQREYERALQLVEGNAA